MHLLLFCLQSGRFYLPDIGFWGELSWFLGWDVSEFLMEAVRKCGNGCMTVLTRIQSWLTQTGGDRNMAPRRLTHTSPSLTGAPLTHGHRCLPRPALFELLSIFLRCLGVGSVPSSPYVGCISVALLLSCRIWPRNEQQLSLLWSHFQSMFVIALKINSKEGFIVQRLTDYQPLYVSDVPPKVSLKKKQMGV